MIRLSKRYVSTLLRSGDRSFRVAAAASISRSSPSATDVKRSDTESRWYSSSLTNGQSNGSLAHLDMKTNWFMGHRNKSSAAASDSSSQAPPPTEKFEYQAADVSRLMDLVVNRLYSNKEVFLRQLISNASDALHKLRYLSVTDPDISKDAADLGIRIYADKENGIITLTDSGIGMTRQELVDSLGTIAQSGTAKFMKALKDSKDAGGDNNLIGQFGVGFYSAFLVADRVIVSTKSPKSDKQYVWEGEANSSSFTIQEETDPQSLIPRGTRITLHLKQDAKNFADPERIQKLVKNCSRFVSFPIYTWQEKGYTIVVEDEETKNADQDDQQFSGFWRTVLDKLMDKVLDALITGVRTGIFIVIGWLVFKTEHVFDIPTKQGTENGVQIKKLGVQVEKLAVQVENQQKEIDDLKSKRRFFFLF